MITLNRARPHRRAVEILILPNALCAALFVLLIWAAPCVALNPNKTIAQYGREAWTTEEGLPHDNVQAILQTRDGYLWVGTSRGLARFDGVRFTIFNNANTPELTSEVILNLAEDLDGNLWVGTRNNLLCFKDNRFTSHPLPEGLRDMAIIALCPDRAGRLWIATDKEVWLHENGTFRTVALPRNALTRTVQAILVNDEGDVWIAANNLTRLRGEEAKTFTVRDGLPHEGVTGICEDAQGGLWIGTYGGIAHFAQNRFTAYTTRDGLSSNGVSALQMDRDGALWIGTNGGLNRFHQGKFARFDASQGYTNNFVNSIFEDREGNLWTGTAGGLARFKDDEFTTYTMRDGLAGDFVWTLCETNTGELWIGTHNTGLSRLRDNEFTTFTTRDGLAHNTVRALHQDRAGTLWVGTYQGLSRFSGGKFYSTDIEAEGAVFAIYEDRAGALWVGTYDGVRRLEQNRITKLTIADNLAADHVQDFHETPDGTMWIATTGGLSSYRDGVLKSYTTADGLSHNDVISIHRSIDGALWLTTRGGGINRFQDGRFTHITKRDGLPDDETYRLLEDAHGFYWISTRSGIFRVSVRDVNDFADGKLASLSGTTYGKADGMESDECNGSQSSSLVARDGRLWFATIKGVSVVEPVRAGVSATAPSVVIERARADYEELRLKPEMTLSPDVRNVEFDYTGLSFIDPKNIRFRYKLEGFNQDWVEAGTRRTAFYTNLAPGDYRFRVIAATSDGVWGDTGATLPLTIRPHFYQTPFFAVLCVGAVLLTTWLLYRSRTYRLERQFALVMQERTRLAREVHDTLAQGFVGVSTQLEVVAELLDKTPERALHHLDRARELARSSLAEARRAVYDLRSPSLEEADLATALARFARLMTENTTVKCDVVTLGRARPVADSIENGLLRIGQEALANAVRHARASRIHVELTYYPAEIELRVTDDGCGFDPNEPYPTVPGSGFGVRGMRERAEKINGKLTITSRLHAGTEVTVSAPAMRHVA